MEIYSTRRSKPGATTREVVERLGTLTKEELNAKVERVRVAGRIMALRRFGKASFASEQLSENLVAIADAILRAKPQSSKGTYLKKVSISTTVGPGVNLAVR